ncbi:hypothetical protein BDZ88DRAFT_121943 [Geranomyces variabilis]|nr:hypothetical protein BDZ88DRAFT_121943 [Geranomyces variabilis]
MIKAACVVELVVSTCDATSLAHPSSKTVQHLDGLFRFDVRRDTSTPSTVRRVPYSSRDHGNHLYRPPVRNLNLLKLVPSHLTLYSVCAGDFRVGSTIKQRARSPCCDCSA